MSSATAQAWPENDGGSTLRLRFRNWRRSRPFWAGLLAMIAGLPILYFPYAKLNLNGMTVSMATTAGAGSLIIGVLMVALGFTAWFQPLVRVFCGVAVTLLALISIPVSNLGGFGLGLILGLVSGGLLMAWKPLAPVEAVPVEQGAAYAAAEPATAELPATEAPAEPAAADDDTRPVLPAQAQPEADTAAAAGDPGEAR
ncbi:DUF6114 domain-containing protein [Kitasatospora sp. NPDC059571]|uniref:DUF6114 domain-containing protein n=1 Tax=Kitasatospora sp. NPDC059571 TaxID=3346871 RepID=UPI0036A9121A